MRREEARFKVKGGEKFIEKIVFKCPSCRMEINQEQFASWDSRRRSLARIAKAVRDKYLPIDKDAVLRACSEVWACEDTGTGMEILCCLVNRLQPERAKEEIYDELCEYQKPSTKGFFSPTDREKFNQYLLRYPPKRTQVTNPEPSTPAGQGKEQAVQEHSREDMTPASGVKRKKLTRRKRQAPARQVSVRRRRGYAKEIFCWTKIFSGSLS